jgi:hypothetical protein
VYEALSCIAATSFTFSLRRERKGVAQCMEPLMYFGRKGPLQDEFMKTNAPYIAGKVPSSCIRQHTSAYVSIRQHIAGKVPSSCIRQHTSAYVSIHQHIAGKVSSSSSFPPGASLVARPSSTSTPGGLVRSIEVWLVAEVPSSSSFPPGACPVARPSSAFKPGVRRFS